MKEVPSVVKLDAPQIGEFLLLIPRAENIVYCSRREDSSRANDDGDELVVLDHDRRKGGIAGGRHRVGCGDSLERARGFM